MFSVRLTTVMFIFFLINWHHDSSRPPCPSHYMINSFIVTFNHGIPIFFTLTRPKCNWKFLLHARLNLFVSLLTLLSGDIELNPEPFDMLTLQ